MPAHTARAGMVLGKPQQYEAEKCQVFKLGTFAPIRHHLLHWHYRPILRLFARGPQNFTRVRGHLFYKKLSPTHTDISHGESRIGTGWWQIGPRNGGGTLAVCLRAVGHWKKKGAAALVDTSATLEGCVGGTAATTDARVVTPRPG